MMADVVILGGGFAGRRACLALHRAKVNVALLDAQPYSTMFPALPDLAGGWIPGHLVHHPLSDLLPPGVALHNTTVTGLDLDARQLDTHDGPLQYKSLLIAAGSVPLPPPAAFSRDRLYVLGNMADALRIRREFDAYLQSVVHPRVLVAGTGYTGLELAMSLHFRARAAGMECRITLVDPTPVLLPSLPERHRRFVLDFLQANGADVLLGTSVESYDGLTAIAGGRTFDDPFFCWATGSCFSVPEVKGSVERLPDGRFLVAPDLSLPAYPEVFAAGDAAAILRKGRPLRKAVNFAFYGGFHAGRNLARRRQGRTTRPFHPIDLGWIVPFHATSIGRIAPGIWIHGRFGVRLHHLMCGLRNFTFRNFLECLWLALHPNQKGTST